MADATILVVEPHIEELPKELANRRNVELVSLEDALSRADVSVLLVDHEQFVAAEAGLADASRLIDTRGIVRSVNVGVK
ncbi:UDP-N-acetyl-D-mannosamine dehydrogenase [compost metagenome]